MIISRNIYILGERFTIGCESVCRCTGADMFGCVTMCPPQGKNLKLLNIGIQKTTYTMAFWGKPQIVCKFGLICFPFLIKSFLGIRCNVGQVVVKLPSEDNPCCMDLSCVDEY